MKSSRGLVSLLFIFAVAGCTAQPATGVPTRVAATATATHLPTASATPQATATPTPFPTLSPDKPYLLLWKDFYAGEFSLYDANGTGRQTFELPAGGHRSYSSNSMLSPDGQWLVFYSGDFRQGDIPESFPITLNLFNLRDGSVRKVAQVAGPGYEDKLKQEAEQLKTTEPDYYKPVDGIDWISRGVSNAFRYSLYSAAWSPDGRTLAFAAQLDGPSSDVYLYDLETGTARRVEDTLQNSGDIEWSSDGKYIVFQDSVPAGIYMGAELHAVRPGPQVAIEPRTLYSGTWLFVGDWLGPARLLVADGTDTAGNFNLQSLDIETGALRPLWMDGISSYAIDYQNKTIAINASEFAKPGNRGLYFVTFDGKKKKVFDGLYYLELFFRGGERHRFLARGVGGSPTTKVKYPMHGDVAAIGLDGVPTFLGKFDSDKISVSPDYAWLVMYDEEKLYLYDKADTLVKTFPIPNIDSILWRPDSQAIFYSTGKDIYFLSIPGGQPRWVDQNSLRYATWVP